MLRGVEPFLSGNFLATLDDGAAASVMRFPGLGIVSGVFSSFNII